MKKKYLSVIALACYISLLLFSLSKNVWADVVSGEGGGHAGSGDVTECSSTYTGNPYVHQPVCGDGKGGGGASWRIYRMASNITSISGLNNLNKANWTVKHSSKVGGNDPDASSDNIIKECAEKGAPYILLYGLNSISLSSSQPKNFYVMFNRLPVNGNCYKNRGCFYTPNTYDAIKKTKDLQTKINNNTFYNGQIVTENAARGFYNIELQNANKKKVGKEKFKKVGGFCSFGGAPTSFTLTAYAVDLDNNVLNGGEFIDDADYEGGGTATVDSEDYDFAGYTWYGWDVKGTHGICTNVTNRTCSQANMPANDTVVYAYYIRDLFQGKTAVTHNGATVDTNWKQNETVTTTAQCPEGGCTVSFNHQIKRIQGSGPTSYSVDLFSNYATPATSTLIPNGHFTAAGPATVRNSGSYTVKPGMIVCETLRVFSTTVPGSDQLVYSTACFKATGLGDSGIDAKVKNAHAASTYHTWQDEVYAKPTDSVDVKTSYEPKSQYAASAIVNKIKDNGGDFKDVVNYVNGVNIGAMYLSQYNSWNNGYNARSDNCDSETYNKPGTVGSTETISHETPCTILDSHVGLTELSITAETNNTIKNVAKSVELGVTSEAYPKFTADIDWSAVSKTAYIRVPYNFNTTATITTEGNSEDKTVPVFAGESKTVIATTTLTSKTNTVTTSDGTSEYTTLAHNVLRKLVVYNPSSTGGQKSGGITGELGREGDICTSYFGTSNNEVDCGYSEQKTTDTFTPGNSGDETQEYQFDVYDEPAGSTVCVALAVFPASSGSDYNYNNQNYDMKWRISDSKCFQVAKRPSIQVWGGNVYAGGNIATGISIKNNLYGYNSYTVNSLQGTPRTFGSWSELGTVSRGSVSGFASGATIGYISNNNGTLNPVPYASILAESPNSRESVGDNPGGSSKNRFCDLIPLTFANACDGNATTGTGGKDATSGITIDKDVLASLASSDIGTSEISGSINVTDTAGDEAMIQHSADNLEITGGSLVRGTFRVVTSDKDIRISGNIGIDDSITMGTFRQAPKLVIFANNNIYIDCGVTNLYGLLVADRVITCSDGISSTDDMNEKTTDTINEQKNSNQLILQGAIVANRLYANRTYGAARGANSIVPAEIIKFDPTLYLWGGAAGINTEEENDSTINGNMEVTYIHEVAPRY